MLSLEECVTLACLFEVAAPKPGNVHRGADFEDLGLVEFLTSAVAIAPRIAQAAQGKALGRVVLEAVQATRTLTATNTNLGTVLLLAPLAKVPRAERLSPDSVRPVLAELTADDAAQVYAAIRCAAPGGMGRVDEADVADSPPADLLAAMRLAADRDLVARQYSNGYEELFGIAVPALRQGWELTHDLADATVWTHVRLMHALPDSLIARKCGLAVAQHAAMLAGQALAAGRPGDEAYQRALGDLDFWLRADGHRRNPGTTADLVTASLFVALRDGIIQPPFRSRLHPHDGTRGGHAEQIRPHAPLFADREPRCD